MMSVECRLNDQLRTLEVIYPEGPPLPCVLYRVRGDQREALWSANFQRGFCKDKAVEMLQRFQAAGFLCQANFTEQPPEESLLTEPVTGQEPPSIPEAEVPEKSPAKKKAAPSSPRVIRLK